MHSSMTSGMLKNDRGVALLIVLLITALLLALVFEFAYATRVSVRAAVNFRDSQRAWFLARSGVNFVGKVLVDDRQQGRLQDNLEQKEWQVVPVISAGDAELRVRWEDEAGKINASLTDRLRRLFDIKSIDQDAAERIAERGREMGRFQLLSEFHEVMSDEEYEKVRELITLIPDANAKISINTAPLEVLQSLFRSLGKDDGPAGMIVSKRATDLFKKGTEISDFPGIDTLSASHLSETSDYFKVHSHATVGEYIRQVEAVIHRSSTGFTVLSWRSL